MSGWVYLIYLFFVFSIEGTIVPEYFRYFFFPFTFFSLKYSFFVIVSQAQIILAYHRRQIIKE